MVIFWLKLIRGGGAGIQYAAEREGEGVVLQIK